MYGYSKLTAIVAIAAILIAVAVAAELTEADFKKMKTKEIQTWLEERGLTCDSCSEKADLVKFALKNVAAKPKHAKREIPATPFWETWASVGKETCVAQAHKSKVAEAESEKLCEAIRIATNDVFMQYGKRTANKLKKKPDAMLKTSFGDIYYNAGRRLFNRLARHCLEAKNRATCTSSSHVQDLMEHEKVKGAQFVQWITNVGIENTNPMYEVVKDKHPGDEL
jgi:lambda repressor-like predicted transcriptional regulator